ATRDGTLWIGSLGGLASWKDGKRTDHTEFANLQISMLFEDRAGKLWVGAAPIGGSARLCVREQDRFQCRGDDGRVGRWVSSAFEDRNGRFWVLTIDGLWRWAPDAPAFFPVPEPVADGSQTLAESVDGDLLVATRAGIRRFIDGKAGDLLVRADEST